MDSGGFETSDTTYSVMRVKQSHPARVDGVLFLK